MIPKTHEDVCRKKRLFMRLCLITTNIDQQQEYESAVNHCDRLTARISEKAKRAALLVILLAVLLLAGCRTTILGTGQAAQGIGRGIGTIIVGTGDFLVDEMNGNGE